MMACTIEPMSLLGRNENAVRQLLQDALGGAMDRVRENAAAIGKREAPFSVEIMSNWTDPEDTEANIAWAREFYEAMKPFSSGQPNVNFPGLGEDAAEFVRAAYEPTTNGSSRRKENTTPRTCSGSTRTSTRRNEPRGQTFERRAPSRFLDGGEDRCRLRSRVSEPVPITRFGGTSRVELSVTDMGPFGGSALPRHSILVDAARMERGRPVLAMGSGPGHMSGPSSRVGATVTGIDSSEEMVAIAGRRHHDIAFRQPPTLGSTGEARQSRIEKLVGYEIVDMYHMMYNGLSCHVVSASPKREPGCRSSPDICAARQAESFSSSTETGRSG